MRAEIVSIGTELLLGTITDTNASYLAQRLAGLGIDCYYVSQVGDNLQRIVSVLERACERSDLVVTTGGLGPTQDDLTREAIAAMLGEEMAIDPDLQRHLLSLFTRRGINMPASNVKQAALVPSATAIPNPVGSAPGWWVSRGDDETGSSKRIIVSMPGVPYEMKRMWEREVEPRLQEFSSSVIVSRTLKIMGLGESRVEELVADLMSGDNPTLAPYAKGDGVHLRITAKCQRDNLAEAEALIAPLEAQVRSRLGDAVYGVDEETPQGVVGGLLEASGQTFALLEVGSGALGALSPLLGAHPLCIGVLGGRDLDCALRVLLRIQPDCGTRETAEGRRQKAENPGDGTLSLTEVSTEIRRYLGADIVLSILVRLEQLGDEGASVKFNAEIVLAMEGDTEEESRTSYSWRATRSEVSRLVGLAALNYARQRLLALVREKDRGVAV